MMMMKHPNNSDEIFEFSLGMAPELTCSKLQGQSSYCNNCETCRLKFILSHVKEWFNRAGDLSKREFVVGLMRRIHSQDILKSLSGILTPFSAKDSTYARSRVKPSLKTDQAHASGDHAVPWAQWEVVQIEIYEWFLESSYWTKSNFILAVLSACEAFTLRAAANYLKNALGAEVRVTPVHYSEEYESGELVHSDDENSYHSDDDENISLLRQVSRSYSAIPDNFSFEIHDEKEIDKLKSDHDSETDDVSEFVQPPSQSPDLSLKHEDHLDNPLPAAAANISRIFSASQLLTSSAKTIATSISMMSNTKKVTKPRPVKSAPPATRPQPMPIDDSLASIILTTSREKSHSGATGYIDFIKCLPIHLSKFIVNLLDEKSMKNALHVSNHWHRIVEEVMQELLLNQQIKEEVMVLQGSLANTVNPHYAKDVDVPVPNLQSGSLQVAVTGEPLVEQFVDGHLYKNDCNFEAGYQGISTRNVIMEERNVYCGAYNVLVLFEEEDPQRVTHTDGGSLLAYSTTSNRKVHFVNLANGKKVGPSIRGHAGSVKCMHLAQSRGFILTGSYDTSIRRWNIHTGKCEKIYRGHTGTVLAIDLSMDYFITGSADHTSKLWSLSEWKCIRTFKHKFSVSAVALSEHMAVTADSHGKVKVWDLRDGSRIKKLIGHTDEVTCIKFDRWHILTCGKDGYAFVWSAVGSHSACLSALRHPKAILCAEFHFLRAITGSEDGRIRIWNIITRECCRILRGNSRSDPILNMTAIDERITVNTRSNTLTLSFEAIKWDYTLTTDSMPPLIQYSSFKDAPVRSQPHHYIRAQRQRLVGSADARLIWRHAARSAGAMDVDMIDGGRHSRMTQPSLIKISSGNSPLFESKVPKRRVQSAAPRVIIEETQPATRIIATAASSQKTRPKTGVGDKQRGRSRRISWGCEHPVIPLTQDPDLSSIKTQLKNQLRAEGKAAQPPDFIYLTSQSLQKSLIAKTFAERAEIQRLAVSRAHGRNFTKPASAPVIVDPRAKLYGPKAIRIEKQKIIQEHEDVEEIIQGDDDEDRARALVEDVDPLKSVSSMQVMRVNLKTPELNRKYRLGVRSHIPQGQQVRPKSAVVSTRVSKFLTSSNTVPPVMPPMLMRPADITETLKLRKLALNEKRKALQNFSPMADPFRQQSQMVLLTHDETQQRLDDITLDFEKRQAENLKKEEAARRRRWLQFATGRCTSAAL